LTQEGADVFAEVLQFVDGELVTVVDGVSISENVIRRPARRDGSFM
jgi:hypothetical protein